jgi:hypothetical protein
MDHLSRTAVEVARGGGLDFSIFGVSLSTTARLSCFLVVSLQGGYDKRLQQDPICVNKKVTTWYITHWLTGCR